jgi:hypothetical protein
MDADEDPDWEADAQAGEAEEKRIEFWKRAVACNEKILKAKPLPVKSLPRGTRLVVTFFDEDEDPLATGPIEFTILDPATCKVLVKNDRHFTKPAEGTLLGCEHFKSPPYKRVFQEGMLELMWWLNFEAGGKRFDRDNVQHTIRRIELSLPSGTTFDLWND